MHLYAVSSGHAECAWHEHGRKHLSKKAEAEFNLAYLMVSMAKGKANLDRIGDIVRHSIADSLKLAEAMQIAAWKAYFITNKEVTHYYDSSMNLFPGKANLKLSSKQTL